MGKYNILIVDDEHEIVETLVEFLDESLFKIDKAYAGDEAFEKIKNNNFDIIVSDQKMPGLDGIELFNKVKAIYPDSIRILITGYGDFENAKLSINKGEIFRYIQKPVVPEEFINCINEAVNLCEKRNYKKRKLIELEEKVNKLITIGNALSVERDVGNLLNLIVRQARKLTRSDAGSLYRIIDNKLIFEVAQNDTLSKRLGKELPFKKEKLPLTKESIAGYVALTGEIVNINDVYTLNETVSYKFNKKFDELNEYRTKSILSVPILNYHNEIIGVIQLINPIDENGNIFSYQSKDEDLMLSLASQAGVAIQTATFIEEIKSIDRMKTKFMTVSGHELRTPVAIINEYIKILNEGVVGKLNKEQAEILSIALKNISHLKELVEDILTMIKLDFRKEILNLEDVSVNDLIKDTLKDFWYFVKERNISVKMGKTGNVIIQADIKKIKQLLSNLLSNAIKFTPDGGEIKFLIYNNPKYVKITVEDSGIGIPPDQLENIFDKFYQLGDESIHSTSKTKFMGGGPGLGLSICKGIVEEHSGKIWAESEGKNKGSRLNVILPIKQSDNN